MKVFLPEKSNNHDGDSTLHHLKIRVLLDLNNFLTMQPK